MIAWDGRPYGWASAYKFTLTLCVALSGPSEKSRWMSVGLVWLNSVRVKSPADSIATGAPVN
jgi:hypothetical protein